MEDKLPRSPELVSQHWPYDVSGSLKQQVNTSTESSAGDADLDSGSRTDPSPVPQFEEQDLTATQETSLKESNGEWKMSQVTHFV